MKKIHYYFCWFNDVIPQQLANLLCEDLPNRESLVSICTTPYDYDSNDQQVGEVITEWLDPADLTFDEYHLIDYRITKEKAHELIKGASAIFLHGGKVDELNAFLAEYELVDAIKESFADVVIGTSAGALNMSTHYWAANRRIEKASNGQFKASTVYNGLGLDNFALRFAQYMPNNIEIDYFEEDSAELSDKMDVYASCWDSAIRSKDGKLEFFGNVYQISDSKIQKIEDTKAYNQNSEQ